MNMLKITLSRRRCPFACPLYAHNPDVLYFEHNLVLMQDVPCASEDIKEVCSDI